ncbi:uncharacterized membrane protein YDL089W [Kluyveromyces marxianus]|uniref:Nuclear rim protein 1 n=2 Tax=Kluyveromyces marxianus TaxID=4911 RepID=W0T629_KLUMD|nr:uncharacterized protein KLMA_20387 [Kluyveromyces marxianus DMKU3-1042]QGN14582.1 putative membrane protein YDL089W [Kluyveromyces marxianus]BAO38845.1 uncharacterized membrane protein YDL089W [Kluyveromyces marxianus DMKU3-1042]BAP70381.1 uncharacterized membrane protein YDL089W [Kluyveromyces marxianus]
MALWKRERKSPTASAQLSPTESAAEEENGDVHNDDLQERKGWFGSLSSMFALPYDWYLSINEDIAVIDWDKKSNTLAWPLGNMLTCVFFAIRLLQDNVISPNIHKLNHSDDAFDFSKSKNLQKYDYFQQYLGTNAAGDSLYYRMLRVLHRIFGFLTYFLLVINLGITYKFLFSYYQTYSIFYWKTIPKSKNVTKKSLHDLNHTYVEDAKRDSLWGMIKYLIFNKNDTAEISKKEHYFELRKWAPSKFLTSLFVSFSPIAYCFLWMTDVTFKTLIPLLVHQYVLWFIVLERYEQKLKDEQILSMSNLAELNSKVIQPKMNVLKQDAMVDATPYNDNLVFFYPAYTTTRSRVFATHSLGGKLIKEKYNFRTNSFEDTEPRRTENFVRFSHQQSLLNGQYARDPYHHSRQPSPRLSPSRYSNAYGGNTPSAPSTPLLAPSQPLHFDHSTMANASRNQNTNMMFNSRRNSHSPMRPQFSNKLHRYADETGYSVSDYPDESNLRGRQSYIDSSPQPNNHELNDERIYDNENNTGNNSPYRNLSRSPFK